MSASKTRLTKYGSADGRIVYAARITKIEPFDEPGVPPGCLILHFNKSTGPSRSNLTAAWVAANKPEVGGYFVIQDEANGLTSCHYENAVSFEASHKEIENG